MLIRTPHPYLQAENDSGATSDAEVEINGTETARPEWMPEKFWDNGKGEANIEALATSYSHQEQELSRIVRGGKTAEEWRNEVRADVEKEVTQGQIKDRPEKVEDYKFNIPDDALPEGTEWQMNEDDPLLSWWRQTAYDNGFGQDKFDAGIAEYVKMQAANMPNYDAEVAALGSNGSERIEAVNLWAKANLTEDSYKALEGVVTTANGIKMVEEIQSLTKNARVNNGSEAPVPNAPKSKSEIKAMQNDPRYWDPLQRDETYVAEVEAAWKRAYPGNKPTAPSNPRGG